MAAGKVGGVSPDDPSKKPETGIQHRRIEKVEKVKSVDETENERTRRQKFQSFMEDEEEAPPKAPSPFETSFYEAPQKQTQPEQVPSLGGSELPPPIMPTSDESNEPESSYDSPLPQSPHFWTDVDDPVQKKAPEHSFENKETAQKKPLTKAEKELLEKDLLEGKHLTKEEKKELLEKEKDKKVVSQGKLPEEMIQRPISLPKDEKEESFDKEIALKGKRKKEETLAVAKHLEGEKEVQKAKKEEKEEEHRDKRKEDEASEVIGPLTSSLPGHIIPMAEAATVQASPYISKEISPLFFHMVGTIQVMVSPSDVSRTEIELTSPNFANSPFYGTKITIERYSIAPDSFNIRLTGSNQAVTLFNKNIPNLYTAFQKGNFDFRIGRIDAEYTAERPVFRRKSRGESDFGGDMSDRKGR